MPAIYDSNGKIQIRGNTDENIRYSPNMKLLDVLMNDDAFHSVANAEYMTREGVEYDDYDVFDADVLYLSHQCDIKEDIKKFKKLEEIFYCWGSTPLDFEVPDVVNAKLVCNLSDLEDLECLSSLHIDNGGTVDIAPLTHSVRLRTLRLYNTFIKDVSYLKYQSSLNVLTYHVNSVKDLQPLQELKVLNELKVIAGNDISDSVITQFVKNHVQSVKKFEIIRNTPTRSLYDILKTEGATGMATATYSDEHILSMLSYADIDLHKTMAETITLYANCDMSDIKEFKNLKELIYDGSNPYEFKMSDEDEKLVCDLSHISSMTWIERLVIKDCGTVDVSYISKLSQLKSLELTNTFIEDTEYMKYLTGLTNLKYRITSVSELQPLLKMTNMEELTLFVNKDISDDIVSQYVSNMPMLKKFDIIRV